MLPDPRWDYLTTAVTAHLFTPKPCKYIEYVSRKEDDVEVITGDLAADDVVSWLDGQVS
jgi:hypothetical protein